MLVNLETQRPSFKGAYSHVKEGSIRESFQEDGALIVRRVTRRDGSVTTCRLRRAVGLDRDMPLADAFDASWLRSQEAPVADRLSRKTLVAADLFSGCGGLSLGLGEACRALGMPTEFRFAADMNAIALDVYRQNFHPHVSSSARLESLVDGYLGSPLTDSEKKLRDEVGQLNFVLAGPPCQGHSDLNNHSRRADPKNQLVIRVTRFVEIFNPAFVLIENVQGIRHDRLGSLEIAKRGLVDLGFSIAEILLSAQVVGVPQSRRRYFLFASRNGVQDFETLSRPCSIKPRGLDWAIGDLLDLKGQTIFDSAATHSAENRRRINYLFDNNLYDLPNVERPACHANGEHSYKAVYGRMRWDQPAPTITTGFGSTGQGRFVHPRRRRTMTPHEAARVQFFPDFFKFGQLGRRQYQSLIGNAVPSKLAYAVALHQLG